MKHINASIRSTSFNCPHCGAHAQQFWAKVFLDRLDIGKTPLLFGKEDSDKFALGIKNEKEMPPEKKESLIRHAQRLSTGVPFAYENLRSTQLRHEVCNAWISRCYNCQEVAFWVHDNLIWPSVSAGPEPNGDLPPEIKVDFKEAAGILAISPRGAAALLRLCIQKLVVHLGLPGNNLNDDIGTLAEKGLDIRVKRALDIVRVIGNSAVHPGQIDLRDDRATAEELFRLVNLIAEVMISQPKHIDAMYSKLPESARKAIEERDKKKP